MSKRYHIFYSGSVQGVGFRYTARSLAQKNNLTGWVRNLPDGRVELQVQGTPEGLEAYLGSLQKEFVGYIHTRDIEELPEQAPQAPQAKEESFQIRF